MLQEEVEGIHHESEASRQSAGLVYQFGEEVDRSFGLHRMGGELLYILAPGTFNKR